MIDMDGLAAAMIAALKGVVQPGINIATTFVKNQTKGLAMQAALITEARLTGQITDEQFLRFNKQLRTLTENFVRTLAHLALITLQKAWNAVAGVLWGTINQTLGAAGFPALPVPAAPHP
jgi:hypothetical protein